MPLTTYDKFRFPRAIVYDTLGTLDFDTTTITASMTNAGIAAIYPLPISVKVFGVAICGNTSVAGFTSFNVLLGANAEVAAALPALPDNSEAGYPPTQIAVTGNALFNVDQAATLVANTPQTFATSVPDAIWPKGGLLTLRVTTTAGGAGAIKVVLLVKEYDTKIYLPGEANRPIQYSDM
jgi:hypothetical protein